MVISITRNWRDKQRKFFTLLLVPALTLLTFLTILPIIYLIVTSLTPWDMSLPGSFKLVGFGNYVRLLTMDGRFWHSMGVQIKLTVMVVPAQVLVGLLIALFIKARLRAPWLIDLSRSVLMIPMVIPPIVSAVIWKILFTPSVSILNYLAVQLGMGELSWLGDPVMALVAVSLALIWASSPFCFLLLYAALMSFPEEPFEAARVDGASGWQIFRYLTFPLLQPTLSIVFLFMLVDSIRAFPFIFGMTDGGPGFATEQPNYYAYREAFSYSHVGYSSTIIVIMFVFTIILSYIILRNVKWNREIV